MSKQDPIVGWSNELLLDSSLNITDNSFPTGKLFNSVQDLLSQFAVHPNFEVSMQTAFGEEIDTTRIKAAWEVGDFSALPPVELESSSNLKGANGAYSAALNTIFLSQEFITQNDDNGEVIISVVLEEIGHAIDRQLNDSDSPGDEGAIFSALVRGVDLSEEELQRIKAEDDSSVITINGQTLKVETAEWTWIGNELVKTPWSRILEAGEDTAITNYRNFRERQIDEAWVRATPGGTNTLCFSAGGCYPLDQTSRQVPAPTSNPEVDTDPISFEEFLLYLYAGSRYLASNPDVLEVYGNDPLAGIYHYLQYGIDEGRSGDSFNDTLYLASNDDLLQAYVSPFLPVTSQNVFITFFGTGFLATQHYIQYGASEGRALDAFDPSQYLASHPGLIYTAGNDPGFATFHFVFEGFHQGWSRDSFHEKLYLASHDDLMRVYAPDLEAATQHYINHGFWEGRALDRFNPTQYLASHPDLIRAYGNDPESALDHYILYGFDEGRSRDSFEEDIYLASHGDLIEAYGYDLEAATQHYINHGFWEGRATNLFDPVAYLNEYEDLQAAYGTDLTAVTRHYISYGFDEGREIVEDDAYEENDTRITAYDLSTHEQTWLSSLNGIGIANDNDWYEIDITPGYKNLAVKVQFAHADGDIDLAIYNANSNLMVTSESTTDSEAINTILPNAGTYFLAVYPYNSSGNTYDLWWDDLVINPNNQDDVILRRGNRFLVDTDHDGGWADVSFTFGSAQDQLYLGDIAADGQDDVILRRGNQFLVDTDHDGGWADLSFTFGSARDQLYLGNIAGDGRDDVILRRGNRFLVDTDHDGGWADLSFTFGSAQDQLYLGNIAGDSRDDMILRRGNRFLVDTDHDGGWADLSFTFGSAQDQLYLGDLAGDGQDDLILRRGNQFLVDINHDGGWADLSFTFGSAQDQLYLGDLAGDGRDDIILRRGNQFLVDTDHDGWADVSFKFGSAQDQLYLGDLAGDGRDDIILRRGNRFLVDTDHDGGWADVSFKFGSAQDQLYLGDLNGDGQDDIILRRGNRFLVDTDHDGGWADLSFTFGSAQDQLYLGNIAGDGRDDVILRRGNRFLVDTDHDGGWADLSFTFGLGNDESFVGALS